MSKYKIAALFSTASLVALYWGAALIVWLIHTLHSVSL